MLVHVLTKRYYDGSGFHICGVTESGAVAQAFCAGGSDAAAVAESYRADTDDLVRGMENCLKPTKWE